MQAKTRSNDNIYEIATRSRLSGDVVQRYEVRFSMRRPTDGHRIDIQKRFDTKREAKIFRDYTRAAIRSGTFQTDLERAEVEDKTRRASITVAQALAKYKDWLLETKPHGLPSREAARIDFISRQAIGGMLFVDLNADTVHEYIAHRLRDVSEHTVSNDVRLLCRLRKVAHLPEIGIGAVRGTIQIDRSFCPASARDRRLVGDELARLVQHFQSIEDWQMALAAQLAVQTACRAGELTCLEWGMVNLKKRQLELPARLTKNRRARKVPLRPGAMALLESAKKRASGELVLGGLPSAQLSNRWKRACAALQIENLRFHDLRHEAISQIAELGLSLPKLMQFSGHLTVQHVLRYTHHDSTALAEEVAQLEKSKSAKRYS